MQPTLPSGPYGPYQPDPDKFKPPGEPNRSDWQSADPGHWSKHNAKLILAAHDYGVSQDHSTVLVAGVYPLVTGKALGVFHIEQMPLNLPPSLVRQRVSDICRHYRAQVLLVDSRSNIAHFDDTVLSAPTPIAPIGMNMSSQYQHSVKPDRHMAVSSGGNKGTMIWALSRTQLFQEMESGFAQQNIHISQSGDAAILKKELTQLQREISPAGNVLYTTANGQHDDLCVALAWLHWFAHSNAMLFTKKPKRQYDPSRAGVGAVSSGGWT